MYKRKDGYIKTLVVFKTESLANWYLNHGIFPSRQPSAILTKGVFWSIPRALLRTKFSMSFTEMLVEFAELKSHKCNLAWSAHSE